MEILSKNHPRFCAKYVKAVGIAEKIKVGWDSFYLLDGKYYVVYSSCMGLPEIGQHVLLAKKVKLPNNLWEVHEIVLPECYWYYVNWYYVIHMNKCTKKQRSDNYVPSANMYCGGETVMLFPLSVKLAKKLQQKRK